MSYRHPHSYYSSGVPIKEIPEVLYQFGLQVMIISGILISPIVLWHLFNADSPQTQTPQSLERLTK